MLKQVEQFALEHNLIQPHDNIIVGLSGGIDSVVLIYLLKQLQAKYHFTLIAAHLDHQWRQESQQDALFCQAYAQALNVTFISKKAKDIMLPKKTSGSQEELGRLLRRCFLQEVAQKYKAHKIALAHHKDDQQENFFIRLIRGTSIAGLAGMKPKIGLYIRPFLVVDKAAIKIYAQEHNLTYQEDYTNQLDIYLRNRIRKSVIPALKACDKRFEANFSHTLEHIQQTDIFLQAYTQEIFEKISYKDAHALLWLDITQLFSYDKFLYPRILLLWLCSAQVPFTPTTNLFKEIMRFLAHSRGGKHIFYKNWAIVKQKKQATIVLINIIQ